MMYSENDITDLTGRYLRGELSHAELQDYQNELSSNEMLQKELELQNNLKSALRKESNHDLKAKFQHIEKEKLNTTLNTNTQQHRSTRSLQYFMKIAAGFLILAGALFMFNQGESNHPQDLFADALTTYANSYIETDRSSSDLGQTPEIKAFLAYDRKDYESANTYFSQIKNDDQVAFYHAVSLLHTNQSELAKPILKQLYQDKSHSEFEGIRWYYALACLHLNEIDQTRLLLQEIIDSDQKYQRTKSITLLEKLS